MWLNPIKIVSILFLSLFIHFDKSQDDINYFFPTRMKTISNTEMDAMCDKLFYLKDNYIDDEKLKGIKFDSIIFKRNGAIYVSSEKIGTWKNDRTIYLSNYKLKFFFNHITNNTLTINTRYTVGNDTVLKQVRLRLESNYKRSIFNINW